MLTVNTRVTTEIMKLTSIANKPIEEVFELIKITG